MKCLVTGATGFIGRQLCQQLRAAGHDLLAYSATGAESAGSPTRALDFRERNIAQADLVGVEVVFHLAGIAHQQAAANDYGQVNHQAAVELAERAQEAGVRVFIFLSSVKAMGPALDGSPRAEQQLARPVDDYGLSKSRAETELERRFASGRMAVCILRPALVYGADEKGNLAQLARLVAKGLPRPPLAGARSMIAREDLCGLMLTLMNEAAPGVSTYIATDGQQYSLQRVYDAIRWARGLKPGRAWCPGWLWRAICLVCDVARPSGAKLYPKLFGEELYSNQRVCTHTSWRPQLTLEESLGQRCKSVKRY